MSEPCTTCAEVNYVDCPHHATEKLYTLQEAETEIERQKCATDFHQPEIAIGTFADLWLLWRCECGDVTYRRVGIDETEDVGA